MALPYSLVLSFENFENHLNLNILVKYFLVLKNYLLAVNFIFKMNNGIFQSVKLSKHLEHLTTGLSDLSIFAIARYKKVGANRRFNFPLF